jgi:hypothetical protein
LSKTPKDVPQENAWHPARYDLADAHALRVLWGGTASPDQQRRALKWVIETCCGTYDMSFRPGGPEGARETDFAEGKRAVGNQIVKLINLNTAKMAGEKEGGENG